MSEVLYEVWLQDDRGEFGDLRRMDDGTWTVRPAWLTGWLPGYSTRNLRAQARMEQSDAASYWGDQLDENDIPLGFGPISGRRVANGYYVARWWHTAYLMALKWERQHGN